MAGINSLSPELLDHIFNYVVGNSDQNKFLELSSTAKIVDVHTSTIESLLLVNKSFRATAARLHNRHKHFIIRQEAGDPDTEKTAKLISELLNDPNKKTILNSIHALTVTCDWQWSSPNFVDPELSDAATFHHRLDQLVTLVAEIPKLRTLTFTGNFPIPISLLHVLETRQPQCHLHIRDWQHPLTDTDHNDPAEIALATSPNLRSITARLWGDGCARPLRRIVSLSPHLESVEIEQGAFGCLIRTHSAQERAEIERLGALFTTGKPSQNSIRRLKSRGGDYVKMLEDVTEMSKLESLDLGWTRNSDFFFTPSGSVRFGSLKHLSVQMGPWYDPRYERPDAFLRDFLAACSPLESLRITDRRGRFDLATILTNHGHSLRELNLHESEQVVDGMRESDHCLSLDEIRDVRKRCPKLQEFTADLERSPTWHSTKEIFEELAKFEKLQKLTLYFPLSLAYMSSSFFSPPNPPLLLGFRDPVPSDYVHADPFNRKQSSAWLENIYSFLLHQKRINKTAALKELCIKLGEWERPPPTGLPASWEVTEGRTKRCFILTESERDDCSDKVALRILRLENFYNERSVKEERELRRFPDSESWKEKC
jgi:hypothetical protein